MGNKQDKPEDKTYPCKKQACDIQDCLSKNNYNQDKCGQFLEDYNKCVKSFAEKQNMKLN